MAKLKVASSAFFFIFFCFPSLSYALASSDIPKTTDVAARDIAYDDLIVLPSSSDSEQTTLPKSQSESSSIPVNENLIPVDLTEANKEETDDTSFHQHHHHHHHHRPRRSGRKEIPYGNDMIHENFKNSGFEEDEGFGEGDGGLRKFHHHHHHHHHHHFDDGEVKGVEKEREGHPHGHWFHQRKFGGEEEHPFGHGFHHHRHHHHEEEERGEGGLLFKLRKFLNGF